MHSSTDQDFLKARLALEEPALDQAEKMASQLRSLGFRVEGISPRGVHFAGPSSLFESVFQSPVQATPRGFTFAQEPQLPQLIAQAGASLYLPTKPEFFP